MIAIFFSNIKYQSFFSSDTEATDDRCSIKTATLKNFAKLIGKSMWWNFVLVKLLANGKLWILQNFSEQVFR